MDPAPSGRVDEVAVSHFIMGLSVSTARAKIERSADAARVLPPSFVFPSVQQEQAVKPAGQPGNKRRVRGTAVRQQTGAVWAFAVYSAAQGLPEQRSAHN